jgi:hypothetical protein
MARAAVQEALRLYPPAFIIAGKRWLPIASPAATCRPERW